MTAVAGMHAALQQASLLARRCGDVAKCQASVRRMLSFRGVGRGRRVRVRSRVRSDSKTPCHWVGFSCYRELTPQLLHENFVSVLVRPAAEAACALQPHRDAMMRAAQVAHQQAAVGVSGGSDAAAALADLRQELAKERARAAGLERSLAEKTEEAECLRRGLTLAAPDDGHSTFTAQVHAQAARTRTSGNSVLALRELVSPCSDPTPYPSSLSGSLWALMLALTPASASSREPHFVSMAHVGALQAQAAHLTQLQALATEVQQLAAQLDRHRKAAARSAGRSLTLMSGLRSG